MDELKPKQKTDKTYTFHVVNEANIIKLLERHHYDVVDHLGGRVTASKDLTELIVKNAMEDLQQKFDALQQDLQAIKDRLDQDG